MSIRGSQQTLGGGSGLAGCFRPSRAPLSSVRAAQPGQWTETQFPTFFPAARARTDAFGLAPGGRSSTPWTPRQDGTGRTKGNPFVLICCDVALPRPLSRVVPDARPGRQDILYTLRRRRCACGTLFPIAASVSLPVDSVLPAPETPGPWPPLQVAGATGLVGKRERVPLPQMIRIPFIATRLRAPFVLRLPAPSGIPHKTFPLVRAETQFKSEAL